MVGGVDGPRHELMRRLNLLALLAATMASSACTESEAGTSRQQHDTLHTMEEALRRFRADLPRVTRLSPSFVNAEALARAYVAALAAKDHEGLSRTLMTRAEFAWLYYPENPIAKPPYELPVGIAWFELEGNSLAGMRRALASYGGRDIALRSLECARPPVVQGDSRLWNGCVVALTVEDDSEERLRLFGSILERDGAFKLASAANDL